MKLQGFAKWANNNGFKTSFVKMADGKDGVFVLTDYMGPYPGKEVLEKQETIKKKAGRCHLLSQSSGNYTAVLIRE